MKRISVAILCLLMAYGSMSAAPITKAQAWQKAAAFMVNRGWVSQESIDNIQQPRRAASAQQQQLTYIFNAPDNKGFVILSGDDCTEPVIGYAEGGSFDEATMPENMKGWLANIEEEIQWMQDNNVQMTSANKIPTHDAIAPLLSSRWGQDKPYNGLCPTGCPAGCLATATAQVMYYYKWPEQTLETIPGYTTYTTGKHLNSLPVTTFDWSQMKDSYSGGTSNAVAKLMQYVGYSVQMDYTTQGSGATERLLPDALKKYFNYSQTVNLAYREGYSIEAWDALIYNEIAEGRPVVYCGYSMGGGHAFVCDGYNGNGLYHINWGWDGYYDNYFRLSVLNPGTTTAIGASDTPDGFAMGQTAVCGFKKPEEGDAAPEKRPMLSSMKIQGSTISFVATNYTDQSYLGLALVDATTGALDVLNSQKVSRNPLSGNGTYQVLVSKLNLTTPGSYKLYPVFRLPNATDFQRFDLSYYYVGAEVADNGGVTLTSHPIYDISAEQLHFVGNVYVNRMCQIDFTLVNNGDEYNGPLYLFASATSNKGQALANTTVAAEEGETQDLSLWFTPTILDGATIYITTDVNGNNVIGSLTLQENDLECVDYEVQYNPMYVSITVKNNSSEDYNDNFVANLYQTGKTKSLGKLSQDKTIPAGGTTKFEYTTLQLQNTKTYYMKFTYKKNSFSTTMKELEQVIDIDWQGSNPTAIDNVAWDNEPAGTWYTTSGVQIGQPTAKGVYILRSADGRLQGKNGKKIVVK